LPGTRELIVSRYPYIIAYRERGTAVEILLVVHTSRRWPEQLP
jgi:toxin ParE1/3/4